MASQHKTLVFDDVAKHNKTDDCWLIISGKAVGLSGFASSYTQLFINFRGNPYWENSIYDVMVYDVTPFMDDHPGGGEVMRLATGKDATVDFGDVGHSEKGIEKMKEYYVGDIDESTIPVKRSFVVYTTEKIYNSEKNPQLIVTMLMFLVPFLILGLAFTVKAYSNTKSP